MARLSELKKCILLAISLLLLAGLIHFIAHAYVSRTADNELRYLHASDSILSNSVEILMPDSIPAMKTLKNQFYVSGKIKNYYEDLGTTFFRNYYVFSTCSIVFATFLVIATFLMISSGWSGASNLIKTFFLITIFISSFYYFLPSVYENRGNTAANFKKMKIFGQIQMNILSYSSQPYKINTDSLKKELAVNYNDIANQLDLQTIDMNTDKLGVNPSEVLKSVNPNYGK